MKIQFDVKYRPQIESGEYKVVTRDNTPVRIICWDANAKQPIIGLVYNNDDRCDKIEKFCNDGRYWLLKDEFSPFDLFIVAPEPELTEFETEVKVILRTYPVVPDKANSEAKRVATQLLELAKKELCKDCAANLDGYVKGRLDALKEMDENRL